MRNYKPLFTTYESCGICGKAHDKNVLNGELCLDCAYIPPHIPREQRKKVMELRRIRGGN